MGNCVPRYKSGFHVIKYSADSYLRGSVFEGFMDGTFRHGQGKMTYANGNRYTGHWRYNLREGYGIMFYKNGDLYRGEWVYDKPHGLGRMIYRNGRALEGMWDHGQFKGNMIEQPQILCTCVAGCH